MSEKRFMIEKSSIVEDGFFIYDNTGKFSFPTTKGKSKLIMYAKQLNELNDETEQLKSVNQELSNIISAIEKGSCRSIDSFLDDYCTDEILKEFDLE